MQSYHQTLKVKPLTSRIHFVFIDASVPPEFHRSYQADITPQEIRVQVTCYGDILSTKSFSFTTQKYIQLLKFIEKLELQIGSKKDANGMVGGTTIALELYQEENIYAKGYNYACSYGTLFGDVERLKSEIESLIPDF